MLPIFQTRRTRALWLSAALLFPRASADAQDASRLREVVDSVAAARLEAGVPGLVVGVFRDTMPLLLQAFGYAVLDAPVSLRPDRPMPIASVTKQITATAVLALVDSGRIALDAPAARYVSYLPPSHQEATVRQLLTQTSGLGFVEPRFALKAPETRDTVYRTIAGVPPAFAPGARFGYNNANYVLLGAILEQVTGTPWESHLRARFFEPLGMRDTRACAPAAADSLVGYMRAGMAPTPRPPIPVLLTGAAGALCSTPRDLARWTHALHGGTLLSEPSYASLTTPPDLQGAANHPYAMGLLRMTRAGRRHLWHSGTLTSGFNAQLAHYPEDSLTIVVLANGFPAGVEELEAAAYLAWRGLPISSAPLEEPHD